MIDETCPIEEVRTYFGNDHYATEACGCRVLEASRGHAVCSFTIQNIHKNATGNVMGGAIFTLADFALAIACNIGENPTVSVSNTIEFLSAAKGRELIAVAEADKSGRSLGFYTVDVRDDLGTHVARMTATCFRRSDAAPSPKKPDAAQADAPLGAGGSEPSGQPGVPEGATAANDAPGGAAAAADAAQNPGTAAPSDPVHDYQQAASAVLDAASLFGTVAPRSKLGRVVNMAVPAARSVVNAAPGIVEKAAPAVNQAVQAAPAMAEKAARGLGAVGGKITQAAATAATGAAQVATGAVLDAAEAAKKAAADRLNS